MSGQRRLSSSTIRGPIDLMGSADVFDGPVTFLPEEIETYLLFVPLHDGSVPVRYYINERWQDGESRAPSVHVATLGERAGWQWPAGARIMRLEMPVKTLDRFLTEEMQMIGLDSALTGLSQFDDPAICSIAHQIEDVLADPRPGQDILCEALVRSLSVHMIRSYRQATATRTGHMSAKLYREVLTHIDAHLSASIRITALCEIAGMSQSAFLRAVKATTGQTPNELIRNRRLEAARAMLRRHDISIGEIAIATGFADQAHLSRSFKKAFGKSPKDWRRSAAR